MSPTSQDSAIAAEAAEWLVELADGAPERFATFAAWLKASPRHLEEFLLASAIWRELDKLDPERRIAVEELIAEARAGVIDLSGAMMNPEASAPAARVNWRRHSFAAGLAVAAGLTAAWLFNPALLGGPDIYRTAKGEQRVVKLEDGSIAHLNTDSKLAVRYSTGRRELSLLRGEAMFIVERDASRPFVVATDVAAVRALGTQFDVYQRDEGTRVSVVQGTVELGSSPKRPALLRAVMPMAGNSPTVDRAGENVAIPSAGPLQRLAAGEQAVIASHSQAIEKTAALDAVAQAIAWRERRLVFRGETLFEVAREFNRYNERPIVIQDESVGGRQLTGVFNADDPESLLLFLAKDPELALEDARSAVVVRAARRHASQ